MTLNFVTIDPGDHTGVCLWNAGNLREFYTIGDCLKNPEKAFGVLYNRHVIFEEVELWSGSSVSFASASRGDLFKLAYLIGAYVNTVQHSGGHAYLVSPRRWKGQLNYKQLRHILDKKFSITVNTDHEASAVGIGLWAKGLL